MLRQPQNPQRSARRANPQEDNRGSYVSSPSCPSPPPVPACLPLRLLYFTNNTGPLKKQQVLQQPTEPLCAKASPEQDSACSRNHWYVQATV